MRSNKDKEKFIELRVEGYSFDKIAKELGVTKPTLIDWSKEFEIEIANLKSIELEVLHEKYFMSKRKRIEIFGSMLSKIKDELAGRDLTGLATEKLFELFIKYDSVLKSEWTELTFKKNEGLDMYQLDDFTSVTEWEA